ncbi:MAG: 16S rRNA (guanine(527)-N(7))-methyltransferase RsmG [Clostridia bacterium]|nr:16S rRNA (guanine(527)-N(7))-methyltransferase RsmG [Clostridia bacterium]
MNIEEFKKVFLKEADKNNINVNDEELENLYKYMVGIIGWNDKVNVTAITEEKLFIVKHFIDSLLINHYLQGKQRIIDIGTGGGFPGIPLKILNKEKKFTLIDSVNKKLNVIRDLSEKIGLENLEVIHTRAEDLAAKKEYREMYDVATTRAVSNLSTILEYMLPFVKVGGIAVCMKGPNYKEELDDAKKAIEILGGKFELIETFNLEGEMERNILVIKKIKNTSNKFPRGQGKPLKQPIR